MKLLYLVRHAKSSWKLDYLDDFERPLNKRGKRDAPLIGGVLRNLNVRPDLLLSSPAARAVSTARTIAAEIGYPLDKISYNEHLYEAEVHDFMEAIASLDDAAGSAMIVSHDPGITLTASRLTGSDIDDIPTAGVVALSFEVDSWKDVKEGEGRELFVENPKLHRVESASEKDEE